MARKALIHKNTNQTINNGGVLSPKLPTTGTLQKGEIAVNYKDGYETLSIENDLGEVVPFASLEQIMSYVDNSLPDLELSSNYSTSDLENEDLQLAEGDSYEEAFSKLEKAILDDEEIVATSLVELNDRINDCTSLIPETILSEQYTPSTDSNEDLFLEAGDTYEEAFSKLEKSINDNEQITSAALSDLDERKADLSYVDSLHEPLYVKEYDYTCSANDTSNGYLFFGNIIPTSEKVGETWYIHYKLYVDLQSTNSTYQAYNKYCTGVYNCYVGCSGSSIIYACLNRQFSTSYRPIYYHLLAYYATTTENGTSVSWETKYANRETNPIKVGFRIQSAYRVTDPRHYKVEVYEVYNCSFSFIDPFEKYGNVYTTAKYGACTTISADSGLQESGDANDTTSAVLAYSLLRSGTNGIKTYSLIMEDKDGKWQSFYTGTGSIAVSKTVNPAQFRLGSKVYYVNRSSDLAANSTLGTSQVYTHRTLIDFRYSFPAITSSNTASAGNVGLTAYKPLYILGSIDNLGYFVLDTTKWWTLDEPTTEDNKIYIRVCDAVYLDNSSNINGQYRGDLVDNGTPYWFKDGMFQLYYKTSSGGGGTETVYIQLRDNNGEFYLLNETYSEVLALVQAGKNVVLEYVHGMNNGFKDYFYLTQNFNNGQSLVFVSDKIGGIELFSNVIEEAYIYKGIETIELNGNTYTPNDGLVDLGTISGGGSGDTNVIETIKVNNVALTPDANKAVNIPITNEKYGNGLAVQTDNGSTQNMTASLTNYVLTNNGRVSVILTHDLPYGATLNINNTGAKTIRDASGQGLTDYHKRAFAGDIITVVYDGTNYRLVDAFPATDYSSYIYADPIQLTLTDDANEDNIKLCTFTRGSGHPVESSFDPLDMILYNNLIFVNPQHFALGPGIEMWTFSSVSENLENEKVALFLRIFHQWDPTYQGGIERTYIDTDYSPDIIEVLNLEGQGGGIVTKYAGEIDTHEGREIGNEAKVFRWVAMNYTFDGCTGGIVIEDSSESSSHVITYRQTLLGYRKIYYRTSSTTDMSNSNWTEVQFGDTNIIESVKVNGTALTPDSNKAVDITVPAAVTESTVSGWGFTKNAGTVTGVKMNGTTNNPTSGVVDLGTVLTSFTETDPTVPSHVKLITTTDISNWNGKQAAIADLSDIRSGAALGATALLSYTETDPTVPSWAKATNKPTYTAAEVGALPDTYTPPVTSVNGQTGAVSLTIPAAVTESTVSGWGFTKNTGTVTGVKINGTTKNPTSGVVDLGSVLTSETSLSKGTTSGSGNAVTDISVSGHTITLTKGSTFLTSHLNIKTVNGNSLVGTGNVSIDTLPTVTSSDNGKVLQVVNGAWSLVMPTAIYSGTSTPNNSVGNDGDLYLLTS